MRPTSLVLRCSLAISALFLVAACGDDNDSGPPSLGQQIDRMGRPAINTAVVDPFNASTQNHLAVQDTYNGASEPDDWVRRFADRMAVNLAILDGLDTTCGNQLLAGDTAEPGRYEALAETLADDRLYMNTDSGSCGMYLAVEANALGFANSNCGGRTPLYDVVDVSYSLLAAGAFSGVTDGVPADPDGNPSTSNFPFLLSE